MNKKKNLQFVQFSIGLGFVLLMLIRQNFPNTLLFESILVSSLTSLMITSIGYFIKWREFSSVTFSSILLSFLLIVTPSFLVLMNIDRSRSFYVLVWASTPRSVQEIEKQSIITFGSVEEFGIIMRLREQERRGLLKRAQGLYTLTTTGRLIVSVADVIANTYRLDNYNYVRNFNRHQSGRF